MWNQRVTFAGAALAGALALLCDVAGCGGASSSTCDPHTIVVAGKCFWEKDRACDAIGCVPPSECVELRRRAREAIECHKK